jgi:YVTN family beta-propeller protein
MFAKSIGIGTTITLLAVAAAASAATTPAGWTILERHTLGGIGGWDGMMLDTGSRRLFVTRSEHVMVIDADSGKLVGDIAGVNHAHDVALATELKRGFISNGHGDSVTMFDLESLKVISEIPVTGKNPDAILFDSASKHVFAFNGHSNNATVIDPATGKVIATMPVPGRPEFAVSDEQGKIFVNIEDKSQVAQVDAKTAKVLATWSLGACDGPTGLAIDTMHQRLFSVCANKRMAVIDARDGHPVATVAIGDGPDSVAYDAATATVFSPNSDGTLTVVHQDDADHYSVVASVATPQRSRSLALDAKTHKVILAVAEFGAAPAPTANEPHPKPAMKPDTFGIVVVGSR